MTFDNTCWCCHKLYPVSEGFGLGRNQPPGLCPNCTSKIIACIREKSIAGARTYPNDCTDSVLHDGESVGIDMPYKPKGNEQANDLVKKMAESDDWEEITMEESKGEADNGSFVVAGGHGHVAVVTTGLGIERGENVAQHYKWLIR